MGMTNEEFMKGVRARLQAAAVEARETERRAEEEAEAKAKARGMGELLEFPPKLSEQELVRRQEIIDQAWRLTVERRNELEKEMERSCHRGPLDSDANL
jgi:hypothetical protein